MASSTMLFHSPQASQRPVHLGATAPQFWQTKREVDFAKVALIPVGGQHGLSATCVLYRAYQQQPLAIALCCDVLAMLQCPLLGIILIRGYLEDYLCLIEVVFQIRDDARTSRRFGDRG